MSLLPVASTPPDRPAARRCQHHQPIEAERDTARRRHRGNGCEKILVERIALTIAPLLLVHSSGETAALLGRVGQFAEPVGELDAAGIDLKPFGDPRIGRLRPRQRSLRRRIFEQDSQTPLPQIRFDMFDQHLAENVRPGVVIGDPHPRVRRRRKRRAVALAIRQSWPSRSILAKRSNAAATVNSSGSAKGSAVLPRNENLPIPVACAACAITTMVSAITAS